MFYLGLQSCKFDIKCAFKKTYKNHVHRVPTLGSHLFQCVTRLILM